ncbi:MAG: hypothetical protein JWN83_1858 [Chitinophagaceae bacterium]|nr:hypothetical protein [Chitinophagaceae bacterium]
MDFIQRLGLLYKLFEDEPNIVTTAKLPGTGWLLYPFIRTYLFELTHKSDNDHSLKSLNYGRIYKVKKIKNFLIGLIRLFKFIFYCIRLKKSVIILTSTFHDIILEGDRKINKYGYAFEKVVPAETITFTDNSNFNFLTRIFKSFIYKKPDFSLINEFINYNLFKFKLRPQNSSKINIDQWIDVKSIIAEIWVYKFFFFLLKPKLIIIEDAHYSYRTPAIIAAKSLNIKTAEFQHGIINQNHYSYILGEELLRNANYKGYYPDFLFFWGSYWASFAVTVSNKISLGNMWYNYSKNERYTARIKLSSSLLILCSVPDDKFYLMALRNLLKTSSLKIFVRFHPLFVNEELINTVKNLSSQIEIDESNDIYEAFWKYEYVISEFSTTMFEGIFLNNNMYVLKESYQKYYGNIDSGLFNFISIEQLIDFESHSKNYSKKNPSLEDIWGTHFEQNYKSFLGTIGLPLHHNTIA